MIDFLSQFKPELTEEPTFKDKKILCILEGKEELKYIYNIFKLNGYNGSCDLLAQSKIKVSWGKYETVVTNCNFKGGGCCKGVPVPVPAMESLEFEKNNLCSYDNIFVMFDSDKDSKNKVKNYFNTQKKDINNLVLLASDPCFESTLIDYCYCGKCREKINKTKEEKYPCGKYKKSFSSLNCFDGVSHLIVNLENYNSPNNDILCEIIDKIKKKMMGSIK